MDKYFKIQKLVILQVGNREDSNVYIRQKQKFGEAIGVTVILKKFDEGVIEAELLKEIEELNQDEKVDGMIVQLPLPKNFDVEKILNKVDIKKDADGLTYFSVSAQKGTDKILSRRLQSGNRPEASALENSFPSVDGVECSPQSGSLALSEPTPKKTSTVPATARAVLVLLNHYEIKIEGKKVVVIGQSNLAGRPISDELQKRGAEVVRCDIETKNIPELARGADILVSATGQAGLVTKDFVNKNQVVVDVGINRAPGKTSPSAPLLGAGEGGGQTKPSLPKVVGDVNFAEVEPLVTAITPVPGGIGPLTVACLFENLLDLVKNVDK
jgi:methylenetetrahydrofolate dehydrogenase (NADP+)/methenyltetrahydrofolate cyclohydrolase